MSFGKRVTLTVVGVAVVVVAVTVAFFFNRFLPIKDVLLNETGLNTWIVRIILLLVAVLLIYGLASTLSWRHRVRRRGWLVVIATLVATYAGMFLLTRSTFFHHTEIHALKYYSYTADGFRFFDKPGVDPKWGVSLKQVTPQIIEQYEQIRKGRTPQPKDDQVFFNSVGIDSIEPRAWYYRTASGEFEIFSAPGVHPSYGERLKPMTPAVAREYWVWKEGGEASEVPSAHVEPEPEDAPDKHDRLSIEEIEDASKLLSELRKKAVLDPDNAALQVRIGELCVIVGDREGALNAYRAAFRADPSMTELSHLIEELEGGR